MKNWFFGSMGSNLLKWLPPKDKDLSLDELYLRSKDTIRSKIGIVVE